MKPYVIEYFPPDSATTRIWPTREPYVEAEDENGAREIFARLAIVPNGSKICEVWEVRR